jgi:MoaA/NifB/PqqE/SkfB family radical SAM enzyme
MRRIGFLHRLGSMRMVSVLGSVLTPIVDNRFVPYPYLMIWVVTRQCNSRCQMCSIWQQKNPPFLSVEQAEQIFARDDFSFVRSLTLTGGEPTLRSDLPELFQIALANSPNLEHVLLATSGLNTRRTVQFVDQMLETLNAAENRVYRFDVQISLDGVGEVHDTVRGIPGFFDQVQATLTKLRELQGRYPRLNLKLSCVLMPYNLPHVDALQGFAGRENLQIYFSPVVIDAAYYNNLHGVNSLSFSANGSNADAQRFFERLSQAEQSSLRFYYQDMAQMVQGEPRRRRCMMGYYGFVLEHNGNVYPCVNCEGNSFGNLLTDSFENVWFGPSANDARRALRVECCPSCTSMCYPPPSNALEMARIAWDQQIKPRLNVGNGAGRP